jgi:2'-5' RNA ligase
VGSVISGGNPLAPAILGASANAQQVAREFDAAGVPPEKRDRAILFAGATGLTEAIGLGRALNKFGLARPFIKRLADIAEEGGQEALQQYLNNVNAAMVGAYDPNRPIGKDVLENAVLGAVTGGVVQGMSAGAERIRGQEAAAVAAPVDRGVIEAAAAAPTARASAIRLKEGIAPPGASPEWFARREAARRDDTGTQAVRNYTDRLAEIEQQTPVGPEREAAMRQAREEYLAQRQGDLSPEVQANLTQPPTFTSLSRAGLNTVRTGPTPNIGAIIAPPSPFEGRKLLNPATGEEIIPAQPPQSRAVREVIGQSDPRFTPGAQQATQPLPVQQQPQAPAAPPVTRSRTEELSGEEAAYYARQEEDLRLQEEYNRSHERSDNPESQSLPVLPRTAERPVRQADTPARGGTGEDASGATVAGPQNAEQGSPRTSRLRVPRATPDNIEQLRDRRAELDRLRYDRGGRLTGDLDDEYRELGSRIAEFENAQARPAVGPPTGAPTDERPFQPATAEDRRRAFEAVEARLKTEIDRATGTLPQEDAEALEQGMAAIDALFAAVEEDADVADLFERAAEGDADAETELRNYAERRHGIDADTLGSVIDARRNARERRVRQSERTRPVTGRTQTGDARYGEDRTPVETATQAQTLSAKDLDTLNQNPAEINVSAEAGLDANVEAFDRQYLDHLEDLRNRDIRGDVQMERWERDQMQARLKQALEVRRQHVKDKLLPARYQPMPAKAKPLSKEEGGRRLVEQAKEKKAEEVPTVVHSNPEIDKKPILAETNRGTVIVANPDNKTGVSEVKNQSDEPTDYKFSSTQVNLPPEIADQIIAFGKRIPDADLADDGREDTPHITVKFGLHGSDPKFAREALAGERPATVKFGKVSLFDTNDEFDVVKVDVESADLHRLNKLVAESQPVTDTHPTYQPHATIAYVEKGKGAKYVGDTFMEGKTVTLDSVMFSGRDGEKVEIPLSRKEATQPLQREDRPIASVQRTGAAEPERSKYWDTPPVPRTPSGFLIPLTKEQQAEQFEYSRAEFRQHATRARVYTNEQGAFTYAAAINKILGDGDAIPIAIDGVAVPVKSARKVIRYLLDRLAEKQSPARKEVYNNLAHALEQAVRAAERKGDNAITIVSTEARMRNPEGGSRLSREAVRQIATHEETHVWQMNVSGLVRRGLFSDEVITSDPDYTQQRYALVRAGYSKNMTPDDVSAEAIAHVAAGQWRDLGYRTEGQAMKYLARVLDRAYTELGAEAVESLRLRTPKSKEAREDVRARRTDEGVGRGTRAGATARTDAGGEIRGTQAGLPGREGEGRRPGEGAPGEVQGIEPTGRVGPLAAAQPGAGAPTPSQTGVRKGYVRVTGAGGKSYIVPQKQAGTTSAAPPQPATPRAQIPKQTTPKKATIGQNVVSTLTLPRAFMASADLSAPLRQGAVLTLPPSQWGRAAKSGIRMLQAISTTQYNRLADELNDHPDAVVGKEHGLFMSTDPKRGASLQGREEDFVSKLAGKIPIVKHSEQAYKMYLDSIRLETFRKYKRVIDGNAKLSPEEKQKAYKAAAEWINIASGRGSLGKLDSAMPALSAIFFAPRYTASRIQLLNPMTYAKNSTTAAGRAVLKQQISDVVQFGSVVAATLLLAHAAGAGVGLDPEDPDFLKIKFGNKRYDILAGTQQLMRLFWRVGKDFGAAAMGEKSEGQGTFDILARFARSKLAPVPSFFVDMLARKDFIGRDFEMSRAVKDRVMPLMWNDFLDAYQREGIGSAAKLTPGLLGVGVQNYEKRAGYLTLSDRLENELRKHGLDYSHIPEIKGDTEKTHRDRSERVERWLGTYGGMLINSPRYKSLSEKRQKAALEILRGRIGDQANSRTPIMTNLNPTSIIMGALSAEREKPARDRRKIVAAPD